jgi:hypothetical protein
MAGWKAGFRQNIYRTSRLFFIENRWRFVGGSAILVDPGNEMFRENVADWLAMNVVGSLAV